MPTKTLTSKTTKPTKSPFKKIIPKTPRAQILAIGGLLLLAIIVYNVAAIVIAKQSVHKSPTKSQIIQYLKEQDQNINLPGELVHDSMKDEGCNHVNFGDAWNCTYQLKKYYKNSGSKDADLQQAIKALESAGCVRDTPSTTEDKLGYTFSIPGMGGSSSCGARVISADGEGIVDIGDGRTFFLESEEYIYSVNNS